MSRHQFRNLAYDRILIYKQPCRDLDLCRFSFVSYLEKRFNQIYRALYGDAMLGHQYGCRKVTETAVVEFCY